jgi:hypothetical protein
VYERSHLYCVATVQRWLLESKPEFAKGVNMQKMRPAPRGSPVQFIAKIDHAIAFEISTAI